MANRATGIRANWRRLIVAGIAVAGLCNSAAQADERDRREGREHPREERYRSPHWVYDNRYHHGRYYPALGYAVPVLPNGYLSLTFGGGRLFFHGGVWFRAGAGGYVVVRPPLGVYVPVLPPEYDTVWIGGAPYYYANDTYYASAPTGGFVVVAPPADAQVAPAQPAPAMGAAPAAAPGTWYYCDSAKAYYPYVNECKEGWRPVPATPPGVTPAR